MSRSNTTHRVARNFVASFLALLLATLCACGGSEPGAPPTQTNSPTPATTKNPAPSPSTGAAATTLAATEESSATAPQQISETDDGAESVADTPPATNTTAPALKLASAATPAPKAAASSLFKEGVHYQRLAPTQPTSVSPGQVEVVEFFWYGCPHCFALDAELETWRKKNKPNYVVFQRVPATWNDATLFHGRIFYTADLLGKLEELHTPLFREIHLNGNMLNTMDKAKAFFTAHGVEKANFDKTFASFALEAKLQNATLLNKRYRVQGVPFFVVNGKYTADVASAGGEEQLLQLLNELTAREHGG